MYKVKLNCSPSSFYTIVVCLFVLCSCNTKKEQPLFQLVDDTGIVFNNEVSDGPLENGFTFRNYYNGGGVALGDLNNDGLSDVFLSSNMGDNKLYLNKGNWKFEDISAKAGLHQDSMWSTGVVFADINNDGWLDIYVCNSGHMKDGNRTNKLYLNNHDLTFTEAAKQYNLNISAYTTQVSFFDYDLDGDLDCFMINNSPIPINTLGYANRRDLPEKEWPVKEFLKGGGDHLYRNDAGHFKEVTKDAGIHGSLMSFGLGVSVGDINEDGYPDVFVSNDSYERDYMYVNNKNGTFTDAYEQCMAHASFSSMGADIADINNDGHPDLFTTDMLPEDDYRLKTLGSFDNIDLYQTKLKAGFFSQYMKNCLQLNDGTGKFCDIGNYAGVSATDWSWGTLFFDADNDGLNDILVCNGVNRDVTNLDFVDFFADEAVQKMVLTAEKTSVDKILKEIPKTPLINKLFRNNGDLTFSDKGLEWGIIQPSFSNGAAYADLDNDGDLDLIINNENGPAFIYKNNSRELNKNNNYVALALKGKGLNTFAIGSTIKVYAGNKIFMREVLPSRGFQSSVDYKNIIGIGQVASIDSIVVNWPDLSTSTTIQPAVNKLQVLTQTNTRPFIKSNNNSGATILTLDSTQLFDKHIEDEHVDFYYERNIPYMLSAEGPKAACGDVNGDGLDDIYIGGAINQPGQLYIQDASGKFRKKEEKAFNLFSDFEDVAALFLDCDNDKDLDLLIGPGGNNFQNNSRQLQFRLYRNDGKGNFSIDISAFPNNSANISVIAPEDFDNDGDMDLFIGGRSVPFNYGVTPRSYLFVNDGKGHYTDITPQTNPEIASVGMVTGATWANITGDEKKELIVTGEWMSPRIFAFEKGHFSEVKSNLNDKLGWWQSVTATDINGDGRQDLILGNIGENFYLRPDSTHPIKIWIGDFNKNGNLDKIITRTVDKKDKPVFLKRDLQDQIPIIKKQNLKHEQFATKTIQELFDPETIKKCITKQFNYPASCIAINKGNGNFELQKLPAMAQMSSVNAICCTDINADGFEDVILAGNMYGFLPQLERLDGSYGNILLNDGKGNFTELAAMKSGLHIDGQVRDVKKIKVKNKECLLFLRNNDYPLLYTINDFLKPE